MTTLKKLLKRFMSQHWIMKPMYLIMVFMVILSGCKKEENNQPPEEEEIYGDSMTEEQNQAIDSCSVPTPPMDSILDINGVPYGLKNSAYKDGTVAKLVHYLVAYTRAKCAEKETVYHNESTPEHFGCAYSYGQRKMQDRLYPPHGNERHKSEAVWGTDCSGLLINAIRNAGVQIENCNSLSLSGNLSIALAKSEEYKDIILEDMGQLCFTDMSF